MSFIDVISPADAKGRLDSIYKLVRGPGGQVDQVLQVHSLRPHTLEGHMAIYKAALHHRGNQLPEWFLEAVGVLVSRINACRYCDAHHTAGMRQLLEEAGMDFAAYDQALDQAQPGNPFSAKEQVALAYAAMLTRESAGIGRGEIDALREQGLSDGEILEVNQAAAYFAYANRTVNGLGVTTEGEKLGLSPQEGEGRDTWQHK